MTHQELDKGKIFATAVSEYVKTKNALSLKRNEIETFIENRANRLNIQFKKTIEPTHTMYEFFLANQVLVAHILYRYKIHYVRHSFYPLESKFINA